ncbi:type IX secretion system membrane protein PorP/SprF [Mucilaginibacter sp.]|uniref:PorP/SprF family type IX secretion system membrane protein n=1 Tax=Mucilaginibacter sp. TaxID=1882438 RepID=UPI0026272BC2|nr:type IX secretion system membrane protein PorP/SprF [Mucilaginibacter sp.]MDB4927268.1 hypothetical protein [Mucilaginibacter sp.]
MRIRSVRKYTLLFILFGFTKSFAQQTLQYSQYMFNGLAVNPAYAGYKEDWTLSLGSRLQWAGVDGAPKTNSLSIDGVTNGDTKNIGLGFLVNNDRLGPENNSSVYINYAYRLRLNEEDSQRLCFGIAAGAIQYSIDGSLFNPANTTDPTVPSGIQNKVSPDFRAGIYYYTPLMYVGVSALNLLPQVGLDPNSIFIIPVRTYYATGGLILPLTPELSLKPSIMFKEDLKGPTNMDVASYLVFNKVLWVGAAYSSGVLLLNKPDLPVVLNRTAALTASVAVNVTPRCRIGYSYDFVTTALPGYQSGSHELSFSLSFGRSRERILSPRFF